MQNILTLNMAGEKNQTNETHIMKRSCCFIVPKFKASGEKLKLKLIKQTALASNIIYRYMLR